MSTLLQRVRAELAVKVASMVSTTAYDLSAISACASEIAMCELSPALSAEIEALERDVERYLWVLKHTRFSALGFMFPEWLPNGVEHQSEFGKGCASRLNAAIDAAIAAAGGKD